jgi:hypothetical protein
LALNSPPTLVLVCFSFLAFFGAEVVAFPIVTSPSASVALPLFVSLLKMTFPPRPLVMPSVDVSWSWYARPSTSSSILEPEAAPEASLSESSLMSIRPVSASVLNLDASCPGLRRREAAFGSFSVE